jgi:predicted HTH domain antitoxin
MKNLQVRVGDDDVGELDRLADDMNLSRSEAARTALREGMRRLRMERALTRYLNLEFTLSRAAQHAHVTIHEMARAASERGIPFFRYSLDELRRDRRRAEKWLKG